MSRAIIAILRGVTPDEVTAIGQAQVNAGIDRIKVPLNPSDPIESIRRLVAAIGDRALIGTGPDNFASWINAGATGFGIGSAIYQPGDTAADTARKAAAIVTAYDAATA